MSDYEPLVRWYYEEARPFLMEHVPDRLEDLDAGAERLHRLGRRATERVEVCFLGPAGKGKSTLINALVGGAEIILPFGGLQPLTAQGTVVRYAPQPVFEATYLEPGEVEARLWFPLEMALERRLKADARAAQSLAVNGPSEVSAEPTESEVKEESSRLDEIERAARGLVVARQTEGVPLEYVVDGLRTILGKTVRWGSAFTAGDAARISSVAAALARGATRDEARVEGHADWRQRIEDHATGHLASIVSNLEVGWPSELLRGGLHLVDLPGVGISGDVYEGRTREWIRNRARAIVLVLDPRGMDEASARTLQDTSFLNRLLYSNDAPDADPASLVLVTTHMDEPAEADALKDRTRKKREHLSLRIAEARATVTEQFRDQLLRLTRSTDTGVEDAQRKVIDRLVETLAVHPLSAREYHRLLMCDEDSPPFIKDADESGVPALADTLRRMMADQEQRIKTRLDDAAGNLLDPVLALVAGVRARWEEKVQAAEEVERLRVASASFLGPLQVQVAARRGAFGEFLGNIRTATIPDKVDIALGAVDRDLSAYAYRLTEGHWASLRAAVRREGRYDRKAINVTAEIANRAEAPIADAWTQQILKPVRAKTTQQVEVEARLLEAVIVWAGTEAPSSVAQLKLEQDSIRAESRALAAIGDSLLADLRKAVRDQLAGHVEQAVMEACRGFIARGDDRGAGVARRVRDFLPELMKAVVRTLRKPTVRFLGEQYTIVDQGIRTRFDKRPDPVKAAREILVPSAVLGADRARQRDVLAAAARIQQGAPQ